MRILHYDCETRSAADLVKIGGFLYARDPSTDVRCVSFCLIINGVPGPIETWTPGQSVPAVFVDVTADSEALTCVFNDAFDRQIHEQILTPRYGWPAIPLSRRRCAQAAALARALPGSLDGAAAALKIDTRKTAAGVAAMKRLAKPKKPPKKQKGAGVPDFSATPEELATLAEYNRTDVEMAMAIVDRVGLLSTSEQAVWELDQTINERGVAIDLDLLETALSLAGEARLEAQTAIAKLTDNTVTTAAQTSRILKWLGERGCRLSNLRKETVVDALLEPDLEPCARTLLELRQSAAGAAALKFATLRRWIDPERHGPRIRYAYRYHGASSGRFVSIGAQLHNLRKPELEDVAGAIAAVQSGSLDEMRARGFERPLPVLGQIARAVVTAAPGHRLFIADLSGIEARGAAYVCGAVGELDQWRLFDRTGKTEDEPYFITGLATFGQPPETARKAGKTGSLAFQYQGGCGAYRRVTGDQTLPEETIAARRDAWRADHPAYELFWRASTFQACQAIRHPGIEFSCKVVSFKYDLPTGFLELTLPSGRVLSYPAAQLFEDEQFGTTSFTFLDASSSKTGRMYHERRGSGAFGGLIFENVIQALCRDLFVEAMPRLEAAGYPIVMHTHDEYCCEVPDGHGSIEEFLALITQAPAWAPELPIAAKARISDRLIEIPERESAPIVIADNVIANALIEDEETDDETKDLEDVEIMPVGLPASLLSDPAFIPPLEPRTPAQAAAHVECTPSTPPAPLCEPQPAEPSQPAEPPPQPAEPAPQSNGHDTEEAVTTASVPFLIPQARKARLRALGYTEDALRNMTPEQALEADRDYTPEPSPTVPETGAGYARGETVDTSGGRPEGPIAQYFYRNERGLLHMRVDRYASGSFPTYRWSNGDWVKGWPDKVVPYRLPELLTAPADALVLVCEGEKDADTAARFGFASTTNPGGADQWQSELSAWFKGKRRVCVVEDNDDAGRKHTAKVVNALREIVPTIGVLRFPELEERGDLSDYFARGGTKDYLQVRIEKALRQGVAREYTLVNLHEVPLQAQVWLWEGHLPTGALELVTGVTNVGKSLLQCDVIAIVTTGRDWPNGDKGPKPGQVIIITAEDRADDYRRRLAAAGADLTKVKILTYIKRNARNELFLISEDLEKLEQAVNDLGDVSLVAIDPITSFMGHGRGFDSHRATDVRSQLHPLSRLAEKLDIAFSAVTHPSKNAGSRAAIDSFIGSSAFIGVARVGHYCIAELGEEDERGGRRPTGRVLYTTPKFSHSKRMPTLAYRVETVCVGWDAQQQKEIIAPRIVWDPEPVDITADEAIAANKVTGGDNRKARSASVKEFVRDSLTAAGAPVLQKIIVERGASKNYSIDQLRRACRAIGAVAFKRRGENLDSPWLWAMPEHVPNDAETEKEEGET